MKAKKRGESKHEDTRGEEDEERNKEMLLFFKGSLFYNIIIFKIKSEPYDFVYNFQTFQDWRGIEFFSMLFKTYADQHRNAGNEKEVEAGQ